MGRKHYPNRFLLLLILIVSGCSTPEYLGDLASSLNLSQETETAPLIFYEWSLGATGEELSLEMTRLMPLAEKQSEPVALIQLAIVRLALEPGSSRPEFGDLNTLQQSCVSPTCEDYVRLATVLQMLVDERQKLDLALSEQVRGQKNLATLQTELMAFRNRIAALEAQIDALTNLEQEIIQRELYHLPQ